MKKQAKPLELRLYGGRTMLSWATIGYCGVAGLGLLSATNTSGIDALGRGILFVVFAVCFAGIIITLIRGMIGQHDRPTFYADRNGFRIMSGRMRVWRDFHGARVVALRGQYGEVAEKVQIKVRPSGLFAYRTTAVLGSDDYGQGMVDRIIVFKHKRLNGSTLVCRLLSPRVSCIIARQRHLFRSGKAVLKRSPGCLDARRSARF